MSGQSACAAHPWLPAVDKGRGSKSVEVQRVWGVYDERLQFMSRRDALHLDESLDAGDVSRARLVWSGAAEAALADAHRFSGPLPGRGLVLGRESVSFWVVKLGGHQVRKARGNVADAHDAADVFLYRDCSIDPLLDMRRRFKAVIDVLGAMIRSAFHQAVSDVHRRLSDFIHAVVVHRRDEANREWRDWIREDSTVHPCRWLRPDLVPPVPFLQCQLHLTPGGSGCFRIQLGLMKNSERPGFPTFAALGKGRPALRNSIGRLMVGYFFCLMFICLG